MKRLVCKLLSVFLLICSLSISSCSVNKTNASTENLIDDVPNEQSEPAVISDTSAAVKTESTSTTASQTFSMSTTTSPITKAATTISFESADCMEVPMELPDNPFIEPRREIEQDFPLNIAGVTVLNYYFPFPEDFFPEYRRYTFEYVGYTFQDIGYFELITSIQNPEFFDENFNYVGEQLVHGKEFEPSDIRRISVGDEIGDLTVENAAFSFEARFDYGSAGTSPKSGFLKLAGSVTLTGILIKDSDIIFFVYPDSIQENKFPFLNLGGSRTTMISTDEVGLYSEYPALCFLLDKTGIDLRDRSFCEAEITFTNIEESWNQNENDDYYDFCVCTAEKAEIKILC